MTFKKSNEAFWWSLFSAGGVASAMFMPACLVVVGVILPNQYLDELYQVVITPGIDNERPLTRDFLYAERPDRGVEASDPSEQLTRA